MKRLTKVEALRLTAEMWAWLGEDPKREKTGWPGWEATGWAIDEVSCECFLCKYDDEHGPADCSNCPLYGKWDGCKECCDEGSPFVKWSENVGKKRQQAAQLIAHLCRDELARLEAGRKVRK